ncbi:hypothetical protein LTS18_000549, partial [Coniosporium uncinatum]
MNGQSKDPTASECWNTLSEPAGADEGLGAIVKIEDGRQLLADAHDDFFRLLYHQGVRLRKKRDRLRDMLALWQVADMYMSTIAEGTIKAVLLEVRLDLHEYIYPDNSGLMHMLELGIKLKCYDTFRVAAALLVG